MVSYCSYSPFYIEALVLLAPFKFVAFLILFGALLLFLWLKLKRWWRVLPVCLLGLFVAYVMYAPIAFSYQMENIEEHVSQEEYEPHLADYYMKSAEAEIVAHRLPVKALSPCNVGFLVQGDGTASSGLYSFKDSYPSSPKALVLQEWVEGAHRHCSNSVSIKPGKEERGSEQEELRKALENMCYTGRDPIYFYNRNEKDTHGFEMEWCREVGNSRAIYCEASGQSVLASDGFQF